MPARKNAVKLSVEWRERIRIAEILLRVQEHALGQVDMKPTELRAAEVLLRKALPDLATVEHTGEVSVRSLTEMSREELLAIAAGSREGNLIEGRGEELASDIH